MAAPRGPVSPKVHGAYLGAFSGVSIGAIVVGLIEAYITHKALPGVLVTLIDGATGALLSAIGAYVAPLLQGLTTRAAAELHALPPPPQPLVLTGGGGGGRFAGYSGTGTGTGGGGSGVMTSGGGVPGASSIAVGGSFGTGANPTKPYPEPEPMTPDTPGPTP